MADVADSKSVGSDTVRVQVPPSALSETLSAQGFHFSYIHIHIHSIHTCIFTPTTAFIHIEEVKQMFRSHDDVLSLIRRERLVAILRGVPESRIDGVVAALIRGGVKVLEVTFDHTGSDCLQENANKIRRTVQKYGD